MLKLSISISTIYRRTLAANVPKEENDIPYTNYFNKATPSSLFFTSIQLTETLNVIHLLNKSHANGHDNISSFFLKTAAEVFASPLTVLFNYALLFDVFPDALKIAKVVPIHKGNSISRVSNYLPISILPTISKVFKKLIYTRTISFLTKHSILIPTEYGFRSNYVTLHALIDTVTNGYNNIQNNCFTAFLLLGLKKRLIR